MFVTILATVSIVYTALAGTAGHVQSTPAGRDRALMRRGVLVKHKASSTTTGEAGCYPAAQRTDGNGFTFQCDPPLKGCGDAVPGSPETKRLSISLKEFNSSVAAFGDRLVKAADASDAVRQCGSFYNFGDYTWCNKAMPMLSDFGKQNLYSGNTCTVTSSPDKSVVMLDTSEDQKLRERNLGQYIGLSYGISDSDPWSEMMSSMFLVKTYLFDCYVNSGKGPMFNDMHGKHSKDRQCSGPDCYSVEYETKRVCVDTDPSRDASKNFEPLSVALKDRPPLSTFVKIDVEGSEWGVLDALLRSPEDMKRIRTLDMEVHLTMDGYALFEPSERVRIMEELARKFAVTGSSIEPLHIDLQREFDESRRSNRTYLKDLPQGSLGPHYTSQGLVLDQYTISYVNRALL